MIKDKYYRIYYNGRIIAYGSANRWQVQDWKKAGYNVLSTSRLWVA